MPAAPGIIDTRSLPRTAWKNGGGTTQTVAVSPEGAGLDDFSWRISIAEIAESGSFSLFPGVDRTILLLSGEGLVMESADGTVATLSDPFVPYGFAGEIKIYARLLDGPTRDLNVMVRRDFGTGAVDCWRSAATLQIHSAYALFLCAQGAFQVNRLSLQAGEACSIAPMEPGTTAVPQSEGAVLIGVFIQETI